MKNERTWAHRAVWRIGSCLPRSWRIELLKGLAWPEFEITRLWIVDGPMGPEVHRIGVPRRNEIGA